MTEPKFEIGADLFTSGTRGTLLDVRETSGGVLVYGVVDVNGGVNYYTESSLKRAS